MVEGVDEILVRCYSVLRAGHPQFVPEASATLENLYADPSIPPFLASVAEQNPHEILRRYALVGLARVLNSFIPNYSNEQLAWTRTTLAGLLQRETFDDNLNYLLDFSCDLAHNLRKRGGFPELIEFLLEALSSESRLSLAASGWANAIESGAVPGEQLLPSLPLIVQCILSLFLSLNSIDRVRAIELLNALLEAGLPILTECPALLDSIQECLSLSVASENELENVRLVALVGSILESDFEAYCECFLPFMREVIVAATVPPNIRDSWFAGFLEFAKHPEVLEESFDEILLAALACLYAECELEPDVFQPVMIDNFLAVFGGVPDLDRVLLTRLLEYCQGAQDATSFRIGLACLGFVASSGTDVIEDYQDELNELFAVAVASTDVFIYGEFCELVKVLAGMAPGALESSFEAIVALLIERFEHPDSLLALESVLMDVDRALADPAATIERLTGILREDNAEIVIGCIASGISHLTAANEDLYGFVRGVLHHIMPTGIARPQIYRCFGDCVTLAPRLLRGDLAGLMEMMAADLESEVPPGFVSCVAPAFGSLVSRFPLTLEPFAPAFFEFFGSQLGDPEDESFTGDEFEAGPVGTRGEALRCCARIFAAWPEQLVDKLEPLLARLHQWLKSKFNECAGYAADALESISAGFRRIQFHPWAVLEVIIARIRVIEVTPQYLNVIGLLLTDNGRQLEVEQIAALNGFFVEALKFEIPSILADERSIGQQFEGPLYFAIQAYVVGGAFQTCEMSNELVAILVSDSQNTRNRRKQSLAVMVLARICFVVPDQSFEIAVSLVAIAFENLSRPKRCTESITNSYYASIMHLLMFHRQAFSGEQLLILKGGCEHGIESQSEAWRDTSLVVWFMLVALCELPAELDQMTQVITALPPPIGDEGMPHFSCALAALLARNPELVRDRLAAMAAAIVASPAVFTDRIPPEEFGAWCEILRQTDADTLLSLVGFDESHLQTIQSRLG
jgi:hypothetical protein